MRLFFAADIDRGTNESVNRTIEGLKRLDPSVGWVRPGNHHVTIYFFGEADESARGSIEGILSDAARGIRPFRVRVRGMSAFPSIGRPRVIWIGIENPGGELARMYDAVGAALRRERLPVHIEERAFTPHLTIGRAKRGCAPPLIEEIRRNGGTEFGEFLVENAVLYRSVLGREGAVYTTLRTISFA